MLDISPPELVVLLVVALVVIGPERLPKYAAELGRLVRDVRNFARNAREQVRAEMGEEFDDVDWEALDPRRYDPRRIVREALLEEDDEPRPAERSGSSPATDSAPDPAEDGTSAPPPSSSPRSTASYDADAT